MNSLWLVDGKLVTPRGIVRGAVHLVDGRIRAIRSSAPARANRVPMKGAYVAPGFIDAHVWGPLETIAREAVKGGTTAFLTTCGPESPGALLDWFRVLRATHPPADGAACLGIHLEGPFVNPARGGSLVRRWMRPPTVGEIHRLWQASRKQLRLITFAPELRGALAAIRWCHRHGILVSMGHSDASAQDAQRAIAAGARAVTHVFNAMRPMHHRNPSLLDVALTDERLTTMVIFDGVHISPLAFRLLMRARGAEATALVTDSIRYQGWDVIAKGGAYYTRDGTLAGSALRMIDAVRNAVRLGGVSVVDAVRMASEIPARLLNERTRGQLAVGKRADLVVFNEQFNVLMTLVNGKIVYLRGHA